MQTLEPEQGPPESLVKRLRQYLERYDAECVLGWRGASEESILEYIRLCELKAGKSLPVAYLTYLRGLGTANGDLFRELKLITDLKELIEFYHDRAGVREFGEPRGMQESWISDAHHHILVGEECSLYTQVDYAGGTFHRVFAAHQSFLDAVQSQLEPKLGAGKSGRFVLHNGKITTARA